MNTDYNLTSCLSCLVKKHGVCKKVPISPLIMRHQSQRDLPVGPTAQTNQSRNSGPANDDIPTGNLLSLHNMHPNTNQQPIYSLHEDSSLTMPSRSPSDLPITCRDLQFLGKYPKGLRKRCHYRNLAADVRYQMWLEHWVWKCSN